MAGYVVNMDDVGNCLVPDLRMLTAASILQKAMDGSETNDFNKEECEAMKLAIDILKHISCISTRQVISNYERRRFISNEFVFDKYIEDLMIDHTIDFIKKAENCKDVFRFEDEGYDKSTDSNIKKMKLYVVLK